MPSDPAAAVRALRSCRAAMLRLSMQVKIGGKVYELAQRIVVAIDVLAAELTGDPHYFWGIGAGATEDQRRIIDEKEARERGALPWKKR